MSLKNFLDLRKKTDPQIKIVEKIIIQKRSIKSDIFLTLAVIFVASSVIWGISKADNIDLSNLIQEEAPQNFSASGVVSNITNIFGTYISIENAKGGDGRSSYSFSANEVTKIENSKNIPLSLSDIKVGDRIVVQGVIKDLNKIEAYRIISFPNAQKKEDIVATSTEEVVETATSTATSTEDKVEGGDSGDQTISTSIENATSSDLSADTTSASSSDPVTTSTDTASSSDSNTSQASSTQETDILDEENSSTSASSTDAIPPVLPEFLTSPAEPTPTPPPLTEIVKETVEAVVDIVTGGSDTNTLSPTLPSSDTNTSNSQ